MSDIAGSKTYKVLDVRKASDSERGGYEQAHIIGSVSADVDGAVSGTDTAAATANIKAAIAGDASTTKYVLACYTGRSYAAAATKILVAAGVSADNIFTLEGGMAAWNEKYINYVAKSYTSTKGFQFNDGITVEKLKADQSGKKVYTVFDVRDAVSYASGHIGTAVSTPLKDGYDGKDLTETTGKAMLQSAVSANPNGYYVIVCYSGNSYVELASKYLKALGVAEGQIISLEGGAAAWSAAGNDVVKSTVPVTVDSASKTITLYGVLNGTYLKESTMHYLVTTGCSAANNALFEALCDRVEFAKALEELKATAWNTNSKTVLKNGEFISATNGTNKDYTHLSVNVTWSGNKTPLTMAQTLTTTDKSEPAIDEVFANSSAVANSFQSGCLICSTSCYAGVVANEDIAFGDIKTLGNSEKLPAAGTIVTITVSFAE
jgi:rhodanese-related sulfurtransferase